MNALWEIVQTRLVRRGVPIKNFKAGESEAAAGGTVRRVIPIQEGIPIEAAREIVKFLKDKKLKKVQASIQGDQVRVTSPSKDDLQDAIRAAARARLRRRAAVRQLPVADSAVFRFQISDFYFFVSSRPTRRRSRSRDRELQDHVRQPVGLLVDRQLHLVTHFFRALRSLQLELEAVALEQLLELRLQAPRDPSPSP